MMKSHLTVPAFALVAVGCLAGCATATKLNDVRIGMTKDQVVSLLGTPDSTSAQGNIEYMTYYLTNDSAREQPYSVRLVEGKVESFGRFLQLFDIYSRPVGGGQPSYNPMLGPQTMPVPVSSPAPAPSLASELEKLKNLRDSGVLTEQEFQKAKQKLLSDSR